MISRRAPVATVSSPGDFGFCIPDVWDEKAFLPIYRRLSRARAKHPGLAAVRSMYANTIETHDRLAPLAKEDKPAPPPRAVSGQRPRQALGNLGRLLGAGFGTRVATISQGGFDTHDAQAEAHSDLLQDLGDSLRAWQADLDARGLSERVLTLIWSEFGRRPEDNDSGGTDHGAGGLLLLVGNRANGGIRSEFPGPRAPRRGREPDRHDRLPHASTPRCSRAGWASRPGACCRGCRAGACRCCAPPRPRRSRLPA